MPSAWKARIEARLLNPGSPSSPRDVYMNQTPETTEETAPETQEPQVSEETKPTNAVHVISPGEDDGDN